MATGTLVQDEAARQLSPTAAQVAAWQFYGWPGPALIGSNRTDRASIPSRAVGEVRYVVGWMADQMTRMEWTVNIDGSPDWTLTLPDDTQVTTTGERDHADAQRRAYHAVLDLIDWTGFTVRQITTNLYVAGEFDYIVTNDTDGRSGQQDDRMRDRWCVVSVVNPKRSTMAQNAVHRIHALWPHPADPSQPDAPLFGVLEVLQELDWLSRLARSQSASRISTRGILGIADGLQVANGGDFWDELVAAVSARMADPTDVSPLMVRGAQELVEPAGTAAAPGMKGMSWVIPTFPYDDKLDAQVANCIQRLAYGLPIPPEILLGMNASSRAVAFQVEENSYRAHIEPAANLVASVATRALSLLLPDVHVEVTPDPSNLLARRHSIADTLEAWDRGLVSASFVRDILGIPEAAAATTDDIALLVEIASHGSTGVPADMGAAAENEHPGEANPSGVPDGRSPTAVAAAVGGPDDDGLDGDELTDLSEGLCGMDYALRLELAGATAQAVERARERVGAQARSRGELRDAVPRDVPNADVAARLGAETLRRSGVPVEDIVVDALGSLGRWWKQRVEQAHQSVTELLGPGADPGFTDSDRSLSVDLLTDLMTEHVLATLESPTLSALSPVDTQRVLSVAGGTDTAEVRLQRRISGLGTNSAA